MTTNLRQLEILRAVLRCGTTVDAARELGMSQPAVSNAVRQVESQLGFAVFDRQSNRLIPTEEARILLAEAEPLFTIHAAVQRTARDLRSRKRGRVRVVSTAELSGTLVTRALKRFLDHAPDVDVTLDTAPLVGLIEAVELGTADVGVAIEPYARPDLVLTPLASLRMVCLCPPDSPLAGLATVTPADLAGQRLIGLHTTSRLNAMVEEAFRRSGVGLQPHIEVRFLNISAALVAAGVGAAIVDEITARAQPVGHCVARPFSPEISVLVETVTQKDRAPSRLMRDFLHELAQAAVG